MSLPASPLARLSYLDGLARMEELRAQGGPGILFFEHPPTLSLGPQTPPADLFAPEGDLRRQGYEVISVERGGKATYHGPGQLLGYPVLRLQGGRVRAFVAAMAGAVSSYLAGLGVEARYDESQPGLWVGGAKICALGLSIKRGVTGHGFALNLSCELARYRVIRPCGLDAPVTSVEAQCGWAPALEEAAGALGCLLDASLTPFLVR